MNPLLVLAILSAASMAANAQSQKKIDQGRAAASREERARREDLARKSDKISQSTTELLTGTPAKEKAAAEARVTAEQRVSDAVNPLTNRTTDQMVSSTFAPSSSTRVVEDTANARAKTNKYLNQQAKAGAALSSFGDVMAGNNLGVQRNAQDLGQIGSNFQNWNQFVLPAQLNAANQSGRNWSTLADALQVASMIYGGVGLTKAAADPLLAASVATDTGSGVSTGTAAADALRRTNSMWAGNGIGPYA